VLSAGCSPEFLKDYGFHEFDGTPRQGQSLEQLRNLILAEIDKVKKGQFDEWLIKANINNMRLNAIRSFESNSGRAHAFVDAFALNQEWASKLKFLDELEKISKQQIIDFANKNYNDNYVIVFKKTGKDPNIVKVEKPVITSLNINRDNQSKFRMDFDTLKVKSLKPVFVDFEKEIIKEKLDNNIDLSYIKNNDNELFSLNYIIDMGKDNDKMLPVAVNYLPYLGTDKYSPEQLKQEFYKLGISMGVSTGSDRSYVSISGLESNFEKGIELLEHILANPKADKKIYDDYVDGIAKERDDAKLDKNTILWSAMYNYGKYGKKSSFSDVFSIEELKKFNPESLTNLIKEIYGYKQKVFYYGQNEPAKVVSIINKYHALPAQLKDIPAPVVYPEIPSDKSIVYFVNYDMVQANLIMLAQDQMFDSRLLPPSRLFNEYFGGSMGSIVFQEIREAKGLAYSAYATYSIPGKTDRHNYSFAYVGTQPDKLRIATDAMLGILNNMPKAQKNFDLAKQAILKKIESERITKSSIFWSYMANLDRGINYDYRKDIYDQVQKMNIDDLNNFFEQHIKGKKYTYLIMANRDMVDRKILQSLGEVKELSLEEIFNY
jgi:predicted Zn-dependent peptidase